LDQCRTFCLHHCHRHRYHLIHECFFNSYRIFEVIKSLDFLIILLLIQFASVLQMLRDTIEPQDVVLMKFSKVVQH